jgi:hypothetical protein
VTSELIRPLSLRVFLEYGGDLRDCFDGDMQLVIEELAQAAALACGHLTELAADLRAYAEHELRSGLDFAGHPAKQRAISRHLWTAELYSDPALCEQVTALLTDRERAKLLHDIDCIRRPHPLIVGPPSDHQIWPQCSGCGTPLGRDDVTVRIGGRTGFKGERPFSVPPEDDPHYCAVCLRAALRAIED